MRQELRDKLANLDIDRLHEVLDYDPETGEFTWLVRTSHRARPGAPVVMSKQVYGHRITIDRVGYPAHHLAWFHFYGQPAEQKLSFKDHDKFNIRIANLRLATSRDIARSRKTSSASTTGLKGAVYFKSDRNLKKYRASIRDDTGKRIHLGQFSTPEEAYDAYCKKAAEVYGEFARFK